MNEIIKKPFQVTAEDLVRRIDNEGLSYAVTHYYGRDIQCVDDAEFEGLWKSAYDAIDALEKHASRVRDVVGDI